MITLSKNYHFLTTMSQNCNPNKWIELIRLASEYAKPYTE